MSETVPYTLMVSTIYGQVLVNRYDTNQTNALIKTGKALDTQEIKMLQTIAGQLPEQSVFLDVGANFGLYSLALAETLRPKGGKVLAFEAQRILFYMLAGSVALNSIENIWVHHLAIADQPGVIPIPKFDYNLVASYGSIEFGEAQKEFIGQPRQASAENVQAVSLDSLDLPRVDLLKMDIEGMEELALEGAQKLFSTQRPIAFVEWIKSDKNALVQYFSNRNYIVYDVGMNILCLPKEKNFGLKVDAKILN